MFTKFCDISSHNFAVAKFLSILETPSDINFNPANLTFLSFEIEKIKLEGLIEIWARSIWISLRF